MVGSGFRFRWLGPVVGVALIVVGAAKPAEAAAKVKPLRLEFRSVSFGKVPLGSNDSRSVIVTNPNSEAVVIQSIATTAPDFVEQNTCGTSIAAQAACSISVIFTPSSPGRQTAKLLITSGAASEPQTVTLAGNGETGVLGRKPTNLSFGKQVVNTTSPPKVIQITNSGNAPVVIQKVSITGDFIEVNGCSGVLAPNASCTVSTAFSPKTMGPGKGVLTITGDQRDGPQRVVLKGVGQTPTALTVPFSPIGSESASLVSITPQGEEAVASGASTVTLQTTPNVSQIVAVVDTARNFGWTAVSPAWFQMPGGGQLGALSTAVHMVFMFPGIFTANLNLQTEIVPILAQLDMVKNLAMQLEDNKTLADPLSASAVKSAYNMAVSEALPMVSKLQPQARRVDLTLALRAHVSRKALSEAPASAPTPTSLNGDDAHFSTSSTATEVTVQPQWNSNIGGLGQGLYWTGAVYQVDTGTYATYSDLTQIWSANSWATNISLASSQPVAQLFLPAASNIFDDLSIADFITNVIIPAFSGNSGSGGNSVQLPTVPGGVYVLHLYTCSAGITDGSNTTNDFSLIDNWDPTVAQQLWLNSCALNVLEYVLTSLDSFLPDGGAASLPGGAVAAAAESLGPDYLNAFLPLFEFGGQPTTDQWIGAFVQVGLPTFEALIPLIEQNLVSSAEKNFFGFISELFSGEITDTLSAISDVGNLANVIGSVLTLEPWQGAYIEVGNPTWSPTPTPPPPVPTGLNPGSSSAPGPTTSNVQVDLNWNASSGANSYEVKVTNTSNNSVVDDQVITSTSFDATNLSAGGQYSWTVDACNSNGCSAFAPALFFQSPTVMSPPVPTGLNPGSSSAPGPTTSSVQVGLGWNASSGANSYEVKVTNTSNNNVVDDQVVSVTSYTATNLSAGGQYSWTVDACNSNGCSAFAPALFFQTSTVMPPPVPTGLNPGSSSAPGPTTSNVQVGLSWNASSSASRYEVKVTNTSNNNVVDDQVISSTSFDATNLSVGGQYSWTVDACNSNGCSTFAAPLYFQTPTAVPSVPTGLSPGSPTAPGPTTGAVQVALSWNASSGANNYEVVVTNTASGVKVDDQTVSGTSYTASNLSVGGQYSWDVDACNGSGCSAFASPLYFQTPHPAQPGACPSPTSLTFGSVAVNTTSAPLSVTLTNCGTAPLTITDVTATTSAPGYSVFSESNNCPEQPQQLNAGSACTIEVVFSPLAVVIFSGDLNITDNASNSPQEIFLSGTGD